MIYAHRNNPDFRASSLPITRIATRTIHIHRHNPKIFSHPTSLAVRNNLIALKSKICL